MSAIKLIFKLLCSGIGYLSLIRYWYTNVGWLGDLNVTYKAYKVTYKAWPTINSSIDVNYYFYYYLLESF